MDRIDEFIASYTAEHETYDRAGRLVAQMIDADLRAAGIRCMITSRAKDIPRLEEKCRKREPEGGYLSVEQIREDIVDLAGVRVALYFPGEQDQVDKVVTRLFENCERKPKPDPAERRNHDRKFTGYAAMHYRLQLQGHELDEQDKRCAGIRVEIQVASVLMHAWAEVDHDLVYKPNEGTLSRQEIDILDQLNGLVLAGEMSLEMLQRAGEARVADRSRTFLNHYEVAVHLLSSAGGLVSSPVGEAELGQVDVLFTFLDALELATPEGLAPSLRALHGDLEQRPLAQQVIDALLSEDSSRYELYQRVKGDFDGSQVTEAADEELADTPSWHELVGLFLQSWINFERLVLQAAEEQGHLVRPVLPNSKLLERLGLLDAEGRTRIDRLRGMRNNLVHQRRGEHTPTAGELAQATEELESVLAELEGGLGGAP